MKIIHEVAAPFAEHDSYFRDIHLHFDGSGEIIHEARNVLKILSHEDRTYVVKSFKVPDFLRRLIYSSFRPSKANRSFHHSLRLASLGIGVAPPAAYVEHYSGGLLSHSFYISEQCRDVVQIRDVLARPEGANVEILQAFARFSHGLHQQGIRHLDYSGGNVLLQKRGAQSGFLLVDVNRMQFGPVGFEAGLQNLVRLMKQPESLAIIGAAYAESAGRPPDEGIRLLSSYTERYKKRRGLKKTLKQKAGRR